MNPLLYNHKRGKHKAQLICMHILYDIPCLKEIIELIVEYAGHRLYFGHVCLYLLTENMLGCFFVKLLPNIISHPDKW